MKPRKSIIRHARKMEEKIASHDLDRGCWREETLPNLFKLLRGEMHELLDAMINWGPDEIAYEAADVSAYAMMIADCADKSLTEYRGKEVSDGT